METARWQNEIYFVLQANALCCVVIRWYSTQNHFLRRLLFALFCLDKMHIALFRKQMLSNVLWWNGIHQKWLVTKIIICVLLSMILLQCSTLYLKFLKSNTLCIDTTRHHPIDWHWHALIISYRYILFETTWLYFVHM